MYKRIILVLLLAFGTTGIFAQSFLKGLKEKGKQALREKSEQVINDTSNDQKSKEQPKANEQSSKKTVLAQTLPATQKATSNLTPPSEITVALIEPIGYPTANGTVDGTFTLPPQPELKQLEWAAAQSAIAKLTNKRLVEEYKALSAWYEKANFIIRDPIESRKVALNREILERACTLEKFVDKLRALQAPGNAGRPVTFRDQDIKILAGVLESNIYKRTIKSPLIPLKPYLSGSVLDYFESHGGLENAYNCEKMKWSPISQPTIVSTSLEGVTGTVTLNGMIDVEGVIYRIYPKQNQGTENKAILWETYAEAIAGKDIVIPSHIQLDGKSYPVREIKSGAFYSNEIKSIVIPNTVKKIGANAFANLLYVTSIEIPNSVIELEVACFHSSPELREVHVPNSVKRIGGGCFADCPKLTTVTLPQRVDHFDRGQFQECPSLVNVTLPENLTEIRPMMFFGCKSLKNIVIPNSVEKVSTDAFIECRSLKSVTLSSKFKDLKQLILIFNRSGMIKPGTTEIPGNFHFTD